MKTKYEKPQLVSLTSSAGSAAGETRECLPGGTPSATTCSPTGAGDGVEQCVAGGLAAPGTCNPGVQAGDCVIGEAA
jgi:hypothetical protein